MVCLNLINTLYSDIIVISSCMCDNVVILALNLKKCSFWERQCRTLFLAVLVNLVKSGHVG